MTMVRQASNEDVAGNETEAAELYMEVAQLCIDMVNLGTSTPPSVSQTKNRNFR